MIEINIWVIFLLWKIGTFASNTSSRWSLCFYFSALRRSRSKGVKSYIRIFPFFRMFERGRNHTRLESISIPFYLKHQIRLRFLVIVILHVQRFIVFVTSRLFINWAIFSRARTSFSWFLFVFLVQWFLSMRRNAKVISSWDIADSFTGLSSYYSRIVLVKLFYWSLKVPHRFFMSSSSS